MLNHFCATRLFTVWKFQEKTNFKTFNQVLSSTKTYWLKATLLTFAKLQIVGKVTRPPLFYDLDIINHLLCVEFGLKVTRFCSNFPRTRNHLHAD